MPSSAARPAPAASAARAAGPARAGTSTPTLAELQPSQLDARAPSMTLSGPLRVAGSGFDSAAQAQIDLQADLRGQLAELRGPARAVQLKLDGSGGARRIELRSVEASAGAARATLRGACRTRRRQRCAVVGESEDGARRFRPGAVVAGRRRRDVAAHREPSERERRHRPAGAGDGAARRRRRWRGCRRCAAAPTS